MHMSSETSTRVVIVHKNCNVKMHPGTLYKKIQGPCEYYSHSFVCHNRHFGSDEQSLCDFPHKTVTQHCSIVGMS